MNQYFKNTMRILNDSVEQINLKQFEKLLNECEEVERKGHKIIVSGLGKNVPICDKFVGTMLSLGLNANFLHTNTAVHGDLGMVHSGDLVILLSKSGSTIESVCLACHLQKRSVSTWGLTFNPDGDIAKLVQHQLVLSLEHEGDKWNIVPNNSTVLNLIVLQTLAIKLGERMNVTLHDFKLNHPGGAIGEKLKNE